MEHHAVGAAAPASAASEIRSNCRLHTGSVGFVFVFVCRVHAAFDWSLFSGSKPRDLYMTAIQTADTCKQPDGETSTQRRTNPHQRVFLGSRAVHKLNDKTVLLVQQSLDSPPVHQKHWRNPD